MDTLVTVYGKGTERYVLVYRVEQGPEAMRQVGRWACDADLRFDWRDAVKVAEDIQEKLACSCPSPRF